MYGEKEATYTDGTNTIQHTSNELGSTYCLHTYSNGFAPTLYAIQRLERKMGEPSRPPANGFVAAARKVYNPVGFSKGYNFLLWFIFGGAFLGFLLARLPYLSLYGIFCNPNASGSLGALPGECYYYLNFDRYKVGIMLHLYGILFAGLLACLQFTPIIRYKALILHRIGGWLAILLSLIGIVGALMIARRAFGGGIEAQTITGVMAIAFLGSLLLAVINIKRLQIEEHRKWMLRAWFYVRENLHPIISLPRSST